MKIAQSGTKEGLIKMLNQFYYSTSFTVDFETGIVSNSKGIVNGIIVKTLKRKFIAEFI